MKRKFRLIVDGNNDPYWNMAVDEAVATLYGENGLNTVRFYGWQPPAVSIGYFQSMKDVVDVDFARKNGIAFVRRITGGGAVYHDPEGEITYSVVVPERDELIPGKVLDSYFALCGGIVRAMKKLGIDASFAPINDIVSGGKKISGNAQTRRRGMVLQHGTILYDVNPELMFSVLKVSDEKIRDKMIANVYERVTSVRHIDPSIRKEELLDALIEGFSDNMGVEFERGELLDNERELAEKLRSEKYATDEWNFRR